MTTPPSERPGRLYPFRPDVQRDLYCGRTADGRQFLMGPKDDSTACIVFFDGEGNYLGWEEHYVSDGALFSIPPQGVPVSRGQWIAEVQGQYDRLRSEIGGRLGPIHVHSFAVDDADFDMSISEIPWYLQRLLDDPDGEKRQVGDAEFERLMGLLDEWAERGDYVLTWGGDYHVNKDGEIVFS
jgi:hypothetical protein